ncbi:MAG: hypothetical protein ACKVXR_04550 [Planctomycetota bacterium]
MKLTPLPVPRTAPARTRFGRWLRAEGGPGQEAQAREQPQRWTRVLWLTGVDYFSTLGYQPGIALLAAGALSPIATTLLVALTLLGAVPVYAQVARRSWAGQGSIAMLESLLPGWWGKLVVLGLLGFAATDFVITMTLSAADAAEHAVHNPLLHGMLGDAQMSVTLVLLALLAVVFLLGFREAIRLATMIAIPYLLVNVVVIGAGIVEILRRPELIEAWTGDLRVRGDWTMILLASVFVFPKLALGLSGFETGVAVMPHVAGDPEDSQRPAPSGRIRATRKLLLAAAVIMSLMLLASSLVTTLLIPESAYAPDGSASGRALAYLGHDLLGHGFGTLYDLLTIAILWFAGASAMAGLLTLIPRYLPRLGMAPEWTTHRRPLVLVLFLADVIVTWAFQADVEAQGGAYATGVLVLMLSAAFAVSIALWRDMRAAPGILQKVPLLSKSFYFWIVTAVFAFTLVDNVIGRPDGVIIASAFVGAILLLGALSRLRRSTELRVSEIRLEDEESVRIWKEIVGKKVNLVPYRGTEAASREKKASELRRHYSIRGPLAFLHVHQMDNRSEFLAPLTLRVRRSNGDFVLEVSGAIAIANTIAYVSELLDPVSIFLGLTRQNLMGQAARYLIFGEGEVGLMVYKILLRYWEWTTGEEDVRPLIFLMSD